jgi:hypothetical protein
MNKLLLGEWGLLTPSLKVTCRYSPLPHTPEPPLPCCSKKRPKVSPTF